MGCCVSKKRSEPLGEEARPGPRKKVDARDLPPPEEEKVKEVLSETPSVRPRPKRVAGALAPPSVEKAQAKDGAAARVKKQVDRGRVRRAAAGPAHSLEEKSEAASESSVATTATGPDRSPSSKPPRRRQGAVPGAGEPRRARRDRAAAVPRGAGRASPSPPPPAPRRDPGRRSPSPAAKWSHSQDRRRDAAAAAASCPQRKPARPCGRASTPPQRVQEAPPQPPASASASVQPDGGPTPTHSASPPTPQAPVQEDAAASGGEAEGEGKESLENPLVSMECFIFL